MDDQDNVLLGSAVAPPQRSRFALAGFVAAVLTLIALLFSRLFYPFVYLHLCFPVAIGLGHLARRQIRKYPQRYAGTGMALFALWVGYFSLALAVLLVGWMIKSG